MKKIICDKCQDSEDIYYDQNGIQLCKECYHDSKYYKKTPLQEDYGMKLGSNLDKYKSFISWGYDADPDAIQTELNEKLKEYNLSFEHIENDGDSYYFGIRLLE